MTDREAIRTLQSMKPCIVNAEAQNEAIDRACEWGETLLKKEIGMSEDNTRKGEEIRRRMMCFIRGYITEHGYSPSYREIADGVFLSLSGVRRNMGKLFAEGKLETDLKNRVAVGRAFRIGR